MSEALAFDGKNITPFDEARIAIDDLFAEAEVWLNGDGVKSEAEAKAVDQLLDMARAAKKAADEARKVENEPFDTGKAEVQARYNPVLKRADLITETCKQVLQPWRAKVEAEKAERAAKARAEADAEARKAEEAIRNSAGNIAARAEAEAKLKDAKIAERDAKRVEKAAATGSGLRTTYRADLSDLNEAVKHYWSTHRPQFEALVCDLADKDVRAGIRSIPGFTVIEERKAV